MDDERHRQLMEQFLEGRIKDYCQRLEWNRDTALEFLKEDDKREAERRGMSVEEYVEYVFQRHCKDKLYEHLRSRNAHAYDLETQGHLKEAIHMYEALLKDGFTSSHMTVRLAKIYRKQKQYDDEIRVLERGIYIYKHYKDDLCEFDRGLFSVEGNIMALQERLDKTRVLKAKAEARR